MSEAADDTNKAVQALREREAELREELRSVEADIAGYIKSGELHRTMLEAQVAEVLRAIDIVQRNGRKKPGPKPSPREQLINEAVASSKLPEFAGLVTAIPAPPGIAK
jgi:hypothetical protein